MAEVKKESKYILIYLALVCIYFHDVFLNGALLAVEDGAAYHYPMMITIAKQYRNYIFPFWNPFEYSGFPLLAAIEPGALYPFNVVLPLIFDPSLAFNLNIMLHYVLAGFFTFLYARQIGLGVFASLVSGSTFSLLGYLPAHLNHQSVIASGIWIPLLLFFYERLKQSFQIKYALYAAIIIALQIFAGHPQISFYTNLLLLLYALFTLFYLDSAKRLRFGLLYILSVVSGFVLALPQIVATYDLATLGMRVKATYEFFSSYPFPVHMLPTFLFPFFFYFGGRSGELWGPLMGQEAFIGTFPFLLAMVVIVRRKKNPLILFWWVVAIMALVLALGNAVGPLNRLLYHLPVLNAFRAHSKFMILVSFAISILAGFGLSLLMDFKNERRFSMLTVTVLLSVVMTSIAAFTVFHGTIRDFFIDSLSQIPSFNLRWDRANIPEDVLSITDPSIYTSVIIMSVYLGCVLACFKTNKRNLRMLSLMVIAFLIFTEALSWKMTGIPGKEDVENYNEDLYSILSAFSDGRTVFLSQEVPPLTAMPYGIHLADGYESLETGDYAKIFPRMYLQPPRTWRLVLENNALLSMLNVKYPVVSRKIDHVDKITRQVRRDAEGRILKVSSGYREGNSGERVPIYREIASFTSTILYENLLSLPRAYSVTKLKAVNSADDLRRSLFSEQFHPWYEAAVSSGDMNEIGQDSFTYGNVAISEDRPDAITIKTRFESTGYLVLADQFYPGWEAYIDGKQTRIYKTNAVLRGIVVPGGEHEIVFKYVPRQVLASMIISSVLLAVILSALIINRKKAKQTL